MTILSHEAHLRTAAGRGSREKQERSQSVLLTLPASYSLLLRVEILFERHTHTYMHMHIHAYRPPPRLPSPPTLPPPLRHLTSKPALILPFVYGHVVWSKKCISPWFHCPLSGGRTTLYFTVFWAVGRRPTPSSECGPEAHILFTVTESSQVCPLCHLGDSYKTYTKSESGFTVWSVADHTLDWCCFDYFIRNSQEASLEDLYAPEIHLWRFLFVTYVLCTNWCAMLLPRIHVISYMPDWSWIWNIDIFSSILKNTRCPLNLTICEEFATPWHFKLSS